VKKKRILIDVYDLLVAQTGIRSYILELLEVVKYDSSNEYFITPDPSALSRIQFFKKKGLARSMIFHVLTFIWKQFFLPLRTIFSRVDVLICPDYYAPAWRLKCKKLVVFHDNLFWEQPSNYNIHWLYYFRWIIKQGLHGNSTIVAVSETSKKRLSPIVLDSSSIEVIYTSYEPEMNESSGTDLLSNFQLQKSKYFLHAGVFEKRKNLVTLVRAFNMYLKRNPSSEFKLVLAGNRSFKKDMNDYENVTSEIQKHDLKDKIVVTGYLQRQELDALFAHCHTYVFPSLREGFGLPLLEAMSFGKPIIISNEPALVEIAGDSALVADSLCEEEWCKSMEQITLDQEIYSTLQSNGKLRVKEFSRNEMIKRLVRLYD
jgi:glycosyltransferase involved in cell wall biosynthesis